MTDVHRTGEPTEPAEGRRVRLAPTPPGLWRLILGVALAALAPLVGFLVGSIIGVADDVESEIDPMYLSLFGGILVGAVGVLIAVYGGVRLWRFTHPKDVRDEVAGLPAGARHRHS